MDNGRLGDYNQTNSTSKKVIDDENGHGARQCENQVSPKESLDRPAKYFPETLALELMELTAITFSSQGSHETDRGIHSVGELLESCIGKNKTWIEVEK